MSEQINRDAFLCLDGYDSSGLWSQLPFKWSQEIKEWICFKPSTAGPTDALTRKRLPGAESAELSVSGYLDFIDNYAQAVATLGAANPVTTFGIGRSPGSPVFLFVAAQGEFSFGGQAGEVVPFATDLKSDGIVVRGQLFTYQQVIATGSSSSLQLGAVALGKSLYLHAHVGSVPAGTSPSLAVILESSAIGDFSDAVTRATLTSFTTRGRQRVIIPGPITDPYYRFSWTIGGTGSPSFLTRLAAGIR